MFSTLMQRVQDQFTKELPFVVYRKPERNEVKGVFQHTATLHLIADLTTSGFVFAPFDNSSKPVLILRDELVIATDFVASKVQSKRELSHDVSQKEIYKLLVQKAIAEIENKKFEKVVLSRKIDLDISVNAPELFQRLLSTYESAFCYLWYHPKVGLWLGATPEILLRSDNKQFTTMALAGTQALKGEAIPSWGEKELQEQVLVTNYIKVALKDKVSGLRASPLETVRAGNLLHLRTKLSGRMLCQLDEIISGLHPTPAVCGMPMPAARDFILANENYEREYYTGFLGELNFKEERQRTSRRKNQEDQAYKVIKNKSELFVNLRCMKLAKKVATIYVGGGITSGSESEKEWQETVNKSETILKILS
ncbi:chorismate-binding protein [bacterium]|nr:chorismate-binding protein [bacterium]